MTVKELSQLYYLRQETEKDKARLEELEAQIGIRSPVQNGMPHGSGTTTSMTERLAAEIVDLRAIISARQLQCLHERNRLERYISSIPDSLTREIFKLRFVDGLPWASVAAVVGGAMEIDDSTVRKICYRYLKKAEGDSSTGGHRNVMKLSHNSRNP